MCNLTDHTPQEPVRKVISIAHFKVAHRLFGMAPHLPIGATYLRTVWQLWNQSGRDFQELVILYPKGGKLKIPVPHILPEDFDSVPEFQLAASLIVLQDED